MGGYADELIVTLNRAAEAAVPEARTLFVQSVEEDDRPGRQGHPHRRRNRRHRVLPPHHAHPLHDRFLPIVQQATAKVDLAQKYDQYAGAPPPSAC